MLFSLLLLAQSLYQTTHFVDRWRSRIREKQLGKCTSVESWSDSNNIEQEDIDDAATNQNDRVHKRSEFE